jgi:hypothetical protein
MKNVGSYENSNTSSIIKGYQVNLWKRVLSDCKCQQACLAGMKAACEAMGTTFKYPRAHVAKPSTKDGGRFVSDRPQKPKGNSQRLCNLALSVPRL